jgi:hypothetical protein
LSLIQSAGNYGKALGAAGTVRNVRSSASTHYHRTRYASPAGAVAPNASVRSFQRSSPTTIMKTQTKDS